VNDRSSFAFAARFDPAGLVHEIFDIESHRKSLSNQILPQEWTRDLQKLYIIRAVHGTTAIEGNPLSQDDVARQLDRPQERRHRDEIHRQTENAAKAFKWVERAFAKPRPITLGDILHIHALLTTGSDERDNVPGRLRTSGHRVTVGSPTLGGVHRAPPGGPELQKLVEKYLDFINGPRCGAEHPVIQALIAHFYFVTIHPFGNGNGRTTRCIEAAILYAKGYNTYGFYSLSNFFYRHRDQYFRMLQTTRTEHKYDLTLFLRFGLGGFREELERIQTYIRNRTHRLNYRELIRRCREKRAGPRRRLLNEREAKLLHWILDRTKPPDPFSDDPSREVTSDDFDAVYEAIYTGKTSRTMSREMWRLSELGFVQLRKKKGAARFRVIIDFKAISQY